MNYEQFKTEMTNNGVESIDIMTYEQFQIAINDGCKNSRDIAIWLSGHTAGIKWARTLIFPKRRQGEEDSKRIFEDFVVPNLAEIEREENIRRTTEDIKYEMAKAEENEYEGVRYEK